VPDISYEIPMAGGRAEELCYWAVETLRSLSEKPDSIIFEDGLTIDSRLLLISLQEGIFNKKAQVGFLGQVCVWVKMN
jgi:hypothetical protein